ncbi:MAG: NAD(P)/FAD-dependent oxidoreductase [Gemmataceae bacterium]
MADAPLDVVVMGAGACGLMAAISAAESGKQTLILEKNRKPGVKILMSGGTRCNITHATDNRGIVEAYGPPGRFLHSPLAALSVQATVDFFEAEGVATKVEETGKIFPVSNKALDVLGALLRRLNRSGATLALEEPVVDLDRTGDGFTITTSRRVITAAKVVLTTGGQSYPGAGTTGDGYALAAKFGHTIVPPRPALVPIRVNVPWVAGLRGITLPHVGVRILSGETSLAQRRGSLLFAHFGLSGPVILDVSRVVSGHAQPATLGLQIDVLPDRKEAELDDWLRQVSQSSAKKQLAVLLGDLAPRRLAEVVLGLAGIDSDRRAAGLSRTERSLLVRHLKHLQLPIVGTLGFEKAEVTAGGVSLDEVDSRTMQSKLVPGLYIAGEVLDLDGPIGGYNFQAAWSTGWLAGSGR